MSKSPRRIPAVSVLMPIYNVEPYLRQALTSVTTQTLQNLEIICINDGSTDNSLNIIREFMQQDPRIILIDKPNSGYGDSMNQGLKRAHGEYIGILEPDDWIEPRGFETMYLLAKIHRADVVRANYYRFQAKLGQEKKLYSVNPPDVGRVVNPRTHTTIFHQSPAIWSSLYRRDFLKQNQITFLPTPGASYQDTGFNYKVWATAERAFFTNEAFLHYRLDNESSSVNSPGKVMNVCIEYAEIERYLKEHGLWEELAPLVFATKLNAYEWNALRLSRRLLPEFVERARQEYRAAAAADQLIETYYLGPAQWQLAQSLAHKSLRANLRLLRRHKRALNFKTNLKRLYLALRPSYAKQVELTENLAELRLNNDLLVQRLQLLEQKLQEYQQKGNDHD